jgi:hypothetical protein
LALAVAVLAVIPQRSEEICFSNRRAQPCERRSFMATPDVDLGRSLITTTVRLNDDLLREAQNLSGVTETSALPDSAIARS